MVKNDSMSRYAFELLKEYDFYKSIAVMILTQNFEIIARVKEVNEKDVCYTGLSFASIKLPAQVGWYNAAYNLVMQP